MQKSNNPFTLGSILFSHYVALLVFYFVVDSHSNTFWDVLSFSVGMWLGIAIVWIFHALVNKNAKKQ